MRVAFWGTPDFAVPTFRALEEEGHDVVVVVSQPDRPAGRGRRLRPSPVKEAAEAAGLPVLTPERPDDAHFVAALREAAPDVSVVVAYGHILRPELLDLPDRGSLNVHASLLPLLRGAAPVNWAIVRGHEETGVTVMRMTPGMDEGPILLQEREPIGDDETASELAVRLAERGAQALIEALALLSVDALEAEEQDHDRATYAPKIDRATARVDWGRSAVEIGRLVRGMDEVPGAWSLLDGDPIKLFRPHPDEDRADAAAPGTVLRADDEGMVVAAGRGAVRFGEVQPPGRRRMDVGDWVRGRGVSEGARFE